MEIKPRNFECIYLQISQASCIMTSWHHQNSVITFLYKLSYIQEKVWQKDLKQSTYHIIASCIYSTPNWPYCAFYHTLKNLALTSIFTWNSFLTFCWNWDVKTEAKNPFWPLNSPGNVKIQIGFLLFCMYD